MWTQLHAQIMAAFMPWLLLQWLMCYNRKVMTVIKSPHQKLSDLDLSVDLYRFKKTRANISGDMQYTENCR